MRTATRVAQLLLVVCLLTPGGLAGQAAPALLPVSLPAAPLPGAPLPEAGPPSAATVRVIPVGAVARRSPAAPARAEALASGGAAAGAVDSLGARRRAFHRGAWLGAVLLGTVSLLLAEPWAGPSGGDTDDARPGAGFVLLGVGTGAILGGAAGALVHEVRDAVRGR